MEISAAQWKRIRELFGDASHISASMGRSVPYCTLATVNENGSPHVMPISSLILGENKKGFYFEEFSVNTTQNLGRDHRVCVLVVNNSISFWIKSLLFGRLASPPAIRLRGTVGERREAYPHEIEAFRKSILRLRVFRGYKPLWGMMKHGREVYFDSFEPVNCGPMKQLDFI
ncbi:MAG: pyridoxamine 5'-phosphate oxidase family protein [Thermodesulfobacteriota bacterium]